MIIIWSVKLERSANCMACRALDHSLQKFWAIFKQREDVNCESSVAVVKCKLGLVRLDTVVKGLTTMSLME